MDEEEDDWVSCYDEYYLSLEDQAYIDGQKEMRNSAGLVIVREGGSTQCYRLIYRLPVIEKHSQ